MRKLLPLAVLAFAGLASADPTPAAATAPPAAKPVELRTFEPKIELAAPAIEIKTRELGDGRLDRKVASKAVKGGGADTSVMRAPSKPAIMEQTDETESAEAAATPATSAKKDAGAR